MQHLARALLSDRHTDRLSDVGDPELRLTDGHPPEGSAAQIALPAQLVHQRVHKRRRPEEAIVGSHPAEREDWMARVDSEAAGRRPRRRARQSLAMHS